MQKRLMLAARNSIIFIIRQFISKKSTQLKVDFLKIFFEKVISKGSLQYYLYSITFIGLPKIILSLATNMKVVLTDKNWTKNRPLF